MGIDELHSFLDSMAKRVLRERYGSIYHSAALTAHRGGFSGARVWRLESAAGSYCLRMWPPEHRAPERLRFIHEVLFHAARHGCGVLALPCSNLAGSTFAEHEEHLWELSPWLPGEAKSSETVTGEELRAAMAALGEFHRAVAGHGCAQGGGGPCPAVARRLRAISRFDDWVDRLHWQRSLPGALAADELRTIAACYLERREQLRGELHAMARQAVALAPCLRDIWSEHVLLEAGVVRGIIDYGAMAVDSPATDVARLLGSYAGNEVSRWRIGMAGYQESREMDRAQRQLAAVLDLSGAVLGGMNWIDWLLVQGRRFDDPQAVAARLATISARLQGLPSRASGHWLWHL